MEAETQRWLEKAGLRFEADGLPRTAGLILASLLLAPDARSLDELATLLRVSKGGVSTNARLLERMGAIERDFRSGDRRDYYRLKDDLHIRMLEHWLSSFRDMAGLLEGALKAGVTDDEVVRQRIVTLSVFFTHMLEEFEGAGERWHRDHAEEGEMPAVGAGS